MHERSAFNPFSAMSPLKSYGALRDYGKGYEYGGLPYIGQPHPFKEDDADDLKPQLKSNACCAQFDLSNEEDMKQYRAVGQKVCDSLATISFEEKVYDNDIKSWRVLMRWMEHYFAPPKAVENATAGTAKEPKKKVMPETDTRTPSDKFSPPELDDSGSRYHTAQDAMDGLMQALQQIPDDDSPDTT